MTKFVAQDRGGFSLMEIIIATAILAASGAALLALIGQASQFAKKSEERSIGLMHAESLLNGFIAAQTSTGSELEADVPTDPSWKYKFEIEPVRFGSESSISLQKITVSLYAQSSSMSLIEAADEVPVVRLTRWVRTGGEANDLTGVAK